MALIMALIGIHTYDKRQAVKKAEQAVHSSYRDEMNRKKIISVEAAIVLRDEQQKEREKKDAKIKDINVKLTNALRMLNDREKRPEYSGESPEAGKSCTGRELYREDGEFLIGEAARAEKLIVERNYYYEQYEKARLMIKRINDGN